MNRLGARIEPLGCREPGSPGFRSSRSTARRPPARPRWQGGWPRISASTSWTRACSIARSPAPCSTPARRSTTCRPRRPRRPGSAPPTSPPAGCATRCVSQGASRVAAIPEVRKALLAFQRQFGSAGAGAVLAGRDIGTVVGPDAACKIFVTASTEERARRRCKELRPPACRLYMNAFWRTYGARRARSGACGRAFAAGGRCLRDRHDRQRHRDGARDRARLCRGEPCSTPTAQDPCPTQDCPTQDPCPAQDLCRSA